MTREDNVSAQKRFTEQLNDGDIESAVMIFAEGCVDRDPAPDQGDGREGFRQFFTALRAAFPDAHIEPEHLVAADDNVCVAYTLTGTHQGDFQGVAPTGTQIRVRGMQIGRFDGGELVERWGSSDELGILKQLGAQIHP